jgi:hypothetical protein
MKGAVQAVLLVLAASRGLQAAEHSPLLKDAHVALGLEDQVSPAYNRVQAFVELSPLSILDLRAGADFFAYFGTFGSLVGFPGYDADFSDDARKAIEDRAVTGNGFRYYVQPTLKLKAGRVSLRASADFEWWRMVSAPGPFFYEPFRGTLLDADRDSLVSANALVLVDASSRFRVGAFYEFLDVGNAPPNRRQRLGPMVAWKAGKRALGVRDPVVYLSVLDYLEAPNRSGVSGFVVVSFALGRP